MVKLNDVEEKFLNILGIEFVNSEGKMCLKSEDGEVFELKDTLGIPDTYVFTGVKRRNIAFVLDNDDISRITVDLRDKSYTIREKVLSNGLKQVEVCFSTYYVDNEENCQYGGKVYLMEYEPRKDLCDIVQSQTYVKSNVRTLEPCYVTCGLSTIHGYDTREDKNYGPYELNGENYEMVLTQQINIMYKFEDRARELYLKMVPLFRLIYDEDEKKMEMYPDEYLSILNGERDRINRISDEKIADINEERKVYLEKNFKQQQKIMDIIQKKQGNMRK